MAEKKKPQRRAPLGDKPEPKPKKRAISANPGASQALVRRARPAARRS